MLKRDTTGATLEDRFDKTVSNRILSNLLLDTCMDLSVLFFHLFSPPGSAEGDASEELWQVFENKVHPFG